MNNKNSILKHSQSIEIFLNYSAVIIFPFSIIALQAVLFHLLMIVSNYQQASIIISIALFGIAFGGLVSFYLLRFNQSLVMILASISFVFSVGLSYYSIVRLDNFNFPWMMIFPFFSASLVASAVFSRANSHRVYFVDLTASALGVVFPIIAVYFFKSENTLIMLMILPIVYIILQLFTVKNMTVRLTGQIISALSIVFIILFLIMNIRIPTVINALDYEEKIIPSLSKDLEREIISSVYSKNHDGTKYILSTDDPDKALMAKSVLNSTPYYPFVMDLNRNFKPSFSAEKNYKIYTEKLSSYTFLYSRDSLVGRVEYITKTDFDYFYINNGSFFDRVIFRYRGSKYDIRFPNYIEDAKVFIVGASADGIVKSLKRLPGKPEITGVEFNPIIHETMSSGYFFEKSERAYENTLIHRTEGRAFLRSSDERYDMITHMNNHAEHGAICTIAPEYLHTVEAIQEMLGCLTDRGILVYEEILWTTRAHWFFYKFINTIVHALKGMGVENPGDHILVYQWDYWNYSRPAVRSVVIKRTPFTEEEKRLINKNLNYYLTNKKIPLMSSRQPILAFPGKNIRGKVGDIIRGLPIENYQLPDYYWFDDFEKDVLSRLEKQYDRDFVKSLYNFYPKEEITRGFDFVNTVHNFRQGRYILKRGISAEDESRYKELLDKTDYSYKMDITPITDDSPFPYNVFEEKKEVLKILKITGYLSLLIFFPVFLLMIRKYKSYRFTLLNHTLFFSFTGIGFMLVEIVLMQFFQRFIGAPVYSVIITLGGLLFFSGLGSIVSSGWSRLGVHIAVFLIPAVLYLYHTWLDTVFAFFAPFSFEARLYLAVIMMIPISFLMGVPFPRAMEKIKKDISREYATLMYAISGGAGAVAAVSAIYFNITYGFLFTFLLGMAAYAAGALLLLFILKGEE